VFADEQGERHVTEVTHVTSRAARCARWFSAGVGRVAAAKEFASLIGISELGPFPSDLPSEKTFGEAYAPDPATGFPVVSPPPKIRARTSEGPAAGPCRIVCLPERPLVLSLGAREKSYGVVAAHRGGGRRSAVSRSVFCLLLGSELVAVGLRYADPGIECRPVVAGEACDFVDRVPVLEN
jgi:hypothetical protein